MTADQMKMKLYGLEKTTDLSRLEFWRMVYEVSGKEFAIQRGIASGLRKEGETNE